MVKALIVIDMLEGYMKDTHNPKEVIENIKKLAVAFHKKKYKLILSVPKFDRKEQNPVMIRLWGEEFKGDPENQKLVKDLRDIRFDKAIIKEEYSAFYKTDLEAYCAKNKIDELYLTGVFSGCCVSYTGLDAAYRHIQPYMVSDAAGGPKRGLLSTYRHKITLSNFKQMMGPVVSTKELIDSIDAAD